MSQRIRQPHRDHYEIIKRIVQTVYSKVKGCRSFELAYRCELTWPQFTTYRKILINGQLLILSNSEPTRHYEITPKGMSYLRVISEIEDDLKPVKNA